MEEYQTNCKCKNYSGQYRNCPVLEHQIKFYEEALKQAQDKLSHYKKPTFWWHIQEALKLLTQPKP